MKAVDIHIAGETLAIHPGVKAGQELITLAKLVPPHQLVLEVEDDIDPVVAPYDKIVIRGGEKFFVTDGDPQLPDNPPTRKPTTATLNEKSLAEHGQRRAKVTVTELIGWAGGGNLQVWTDIPDLADEPLSPNDRVILQPRDEFITVVGEEQEEAYDVTVLIDGEAKSYRFAATMTVMQVLLEVLPASDRPHATDFEVGDRAVGNEELPASVTLKDAGVRSGHILSVTKRNGGGG